MSGKRAGATLLLAAALLAGGAQVSLAAPDPASQSASTATDPTGQIAGTTGTQQAQQASSCPTPRLSGLPKRAKFTNATIHFKLTNLTPGQSYLIMAGMNEVLGGAATDSTFKSSFLLPDQGAKNKKIFITAVIDSDRCDNAPWKLQKQIEYKSTTPAPATPAKPQATPPPASTAPKAPAATQTKSPIKPAQKPVFQKPLTEQSPNLGPPPSRRAWLTPFDSGARLDQKLAEPKLNRLDRKADKASSSTALLGLGIVAGLFLLAVVGGYLLFRRRDEVLFERAQLTQLKHLQEGDPGVMAVEEPEEPLPPEEAPFAEDPAPTEPVPVLADGAGAANGDSSERSHAEVEAELQRILNEAGLEAELTGILDEARQEAERKGIALDPALMVQALCEEISGSTKLPDHRRSELRSMFADIIAEEAKHAPAADKVPTQS